MSKEFIKRGVNSSLINEARNQQQRIFYFTKSKTQDNDLTSEYIEQWANRNFESSDYFLNYIKSVFKTENFLTFYKYLRFPLPSAKVVNNRIEPQLERVFYAEDSDFKYSVRGEEKADYAEMLGIKDFNTELFEMLMYYHNSIVVTLLDSEKSNTPIRQFVDIKSVKSIEFDGNDIDKIAFRSVINIEGKEVPGVYYIDSEMYAFYPDKEELEPVTAPHDLTYCPAHFISSQLHSKDNKVMRESLFTYVREELEEFVFLKTLQKMTEPNGAIPIAVKLGNTDKDSDSDKDSPSLEPNIEDSMSSQQAGRQKSKIPQGTGLLQVGTVHEVPAVFKDDDSIDTNVVKDFIKFYHIPVAQLKYLDDRIKEVELSIITTIVGGAGGGVDQAKNETQVKDTQNVLKNTLVSLSSELSRIRTLSDKDMLRLKYGSERVQEVFITYGTDFFLESQTVLLDDLEKASNELERKSIIDRINRNKYKNNLDQLSRVEILYDLLPFIHDKDFDKAIANLLIDDLTKNYQLRFTYWISKFESQYGDIVMFYRELEGTKQEKINLINSLVIKIITDESSSNQDN